MKLYKDGITFELYHPRDIAKYKQMGFVEVKDPEPATPADPEPVTPADPKPVTPADPDPSAKAEKPKRSGKAKDGDQ